MPSHSRDQQYKSPKSFFQVAHPTLFRLGPQSSVEVILKRCNLTAYHLATWFGSWVDTGNPDEVHHWYITDAGLMRVLAICVFGVSSFFTMCHTNPTLRIFTKLFKAHLRHARFEVQQLREASDLFQTLFGERRHAFSLMAPLVVQPLFQSFLGCGPPTTVRAALPHSWVECAAQAMVSSSRWVPRPRTVRAEGPEWGGANPQRPIVPSSVWLLEPLIKSVLLLVRPGAPIASCKTKNQATANPGRFASLSSCYAGWFSL